MSVDQMASCCGIGEIKHLGDTRKTIREAASEDYRLYVFTDRVTYHCGDRLVAFIKKHKLGTVWKSARKVNSNTEAKVQLFVWNVNRRNLDKFKPKRPPHIDSYNYITVLR
jgi:hypothetical protein